MDPTIVARIANEVALPEDSVAATVALFEKGATAPFITRYRMELTGGLAGTAVRAIRSRMIHYREVLDRRASLFRLLNDQNRLTPDLKERIESCFSKVELEDLYQRFRPRKKARAAEATAKGLEPLAEYLFSQEPDAWSLEEHTDVFIDPEKKVATREEALQGAVDIIAEWISDNLDYRKLLREKLWSEGSVISTVVPAKVGQKTKYNMYYDRRERVSSIPSHRVLAIRRGSKEGILMSSIEGDHAKALEFLRSSIIRDNDSVFAPILERAIHESYMRLLRPLIETQVRAMIKERADLEAIRVFQENLANLLLSPPAGPIVVLGIDPGKGDECKGAVVDQAGKLVEEVTLWTAIPQDELENVRATVRDLIAKHGVQAIAMGTGAGTRAIESILRRVLAEEKLEGILISSVNDAGLAIYASSRIAREEFPDLGVPTRCAISLARRLQDPLSELVKVDPKLIGVGQYQHDVDQKELHRALLQIVQACVNEVGVDLNSTSHGVLRYAAGLNDKLARKILTTRDSQGPFASREALRTSVGLEELVYQQVAGFVRIRDGASPLDQTAIHPESYPVVEKMAASLGIGIAELIGSSGHIAAIPLESFVTETIGLPTLENIRGELLNPGRDPRKSFTAPKFRADVREISDLREGMTLEGTVTNVTNFGAFVDIGVHQDGLVHLSQMSNRFIRDPREAVKVGDVVQVKVLSIEAETKRIGLSMKALMPPVPRHRKKPRRRAASQPASAMHAAVEATAPGGDTPVSASGSLAPPGATPGNRHGRPPREGRHPRNKRRREPRTEKPVSTQKPVLEVQPPETSLREKIAILQSKFRGIH